MARARLRIACGLALVVGAAWGRGGGAPPELVRLGDGILGYYPSRASEGALLEHFERLAADRTAGQAKRIARVRTWLDVLLNFDAGRARDHMPLRYPVFEGRSPALFTLSRNWRWADAPGAPAGLAHISSDGKPHKATGTCAFVIPNGAVLVQHVWVDPERPPAELAVQLAVPLFRYAGYKTRACRARWGGSAPRVATDNAPFDFHAGPVPEPGKWVALEVPALDIGLGGMRRVFTEVGFDAVGGAVTWGPTEFRRGELELLPSRPLGIFHAGDTVEVVARASNPAKDAVRYRLAWELFDGSQSCVGSGSEELSVAGASKEEVRLTFPRGRVGEPGHFTLHARLTRPGAVAAARTAFCVIVPNRTGPSVDSPFGALLWDRPASQAGAVLYRDAGIKLVSINPGRVRNGEGPMLSPYAQQGIFVHNRVWDLAFVSAADARAHKGTANPLVPKLEKTVRGLGPMGNRFVSNFWEVDLRTLPATFGLNARWFRDAVHRARPDASVGTGGLAGVNTAWLDVMMANGGAGHVDFVQCMGYCTPAPPERSGIFEEVRAVRESFRRRGAPDTQVWMSEWSVFDHLNLERPELSPEWLHSGVPRHLLSAYMVRQALVCLAAGAARVLPNALFQPSRRPLRQTYGHTMTGCSSHRHDHAPLPLYPAWSVMTRNIEGKACTGLIGCGPGVYCVGFEAKSKAWARLASAPRVLALWSEHGVRAVSLATGGKSVEVIDFVGARRRLATIDGIATLMAAPEPQYVLVGKGGEGIRAVPPVLAPLGDAPSVTAGEAADVPIALRVTNPTRRRLRLRVAFDGPSWCTCQPADQTVALEPKASADAAFTIRVPEQNGDRVHYEMADLVARAEHILAFALFEGATRVGEAGVRLHVLPPLEMRLRPRLETPADQERPTLLVRLRNRGRAERTGTVELRTKARLELTPRSQPFRVAPGASVDVAFAVRGGVPAKPADAKARVRLGAWDPKQSGYYASFGIGEGYVVEAVAATEQGDEARQSRGFAFLPAARATTPPKIDGREDDWPGAAWFPVEPSGRINALPFFCNVHSHKKENLSMYFRGRADLSARWAARWDEGGLYLFFHVNDDQFHQPNRRDMLWNGDCVRFAVDPLPGTADAGIQPVARDPATVLVFDAALTAAGPQLYRVHPACGLPRGVVASATVAVAKRPDGASYELAIPWRELGPLRPRRGGWLGMSIAFHDSDGHGRKTWVNWFGALGGAGREPRLFGDVHLVE